MIDRKTAIAIALAEINRPSPYDPEELEMVLQEDEIQEEDFGWVFYYDSKRHVETGDMRDAIAGNAPLIVNREDGSVHRTGTAAPIEEYIAHYRDLLKGKIVKRAF